MKKVIKTYGQFVRRGEFARYVLRDGNNQPIRGMFTTVQVLGYVEGLDGMFHTEGEFGARTCWSDHEHWQNYSGILYVGNTDLSDDDLWRLCKHPYYAEPVRNANSRVARIRELEWCIGHPETTEESRKIFEHDFKLYSDFMIALSEGQQEIQKPSITIDEGANEMETPEQVKQMIENLDYSKYEDFLTLDEFKEECSFEMRSGYGWDCRIQKLIGNAYNTKFSMLIREKADRESIVKIAFDYYRLIQWHFGKVNPYGIFLEDEKIVFDNGNRSNLIVRLAFSEPLKLWFFACDVNHRNGGSSGGIGLFPWQTGVQNRDVAIFFALLDGYPALVKLDDVPSTRKIEKLIRDQFEKIKGCSIPSYYQKTQLPEFLF